MNVFGKSALHLHAMDLKSLPRFFHGKKRKKQNKEKWNQDKIMSERFIVQLQP